MPYKMVIDIGKLCGSLAGAAVRHRELITADLADMLRAIMEDGQVLPDVHQLQSFVATELNQIHQKLLESSREVNEELTEDRWDRVERDQYWKQTREQLVAGRQVLNVVFGPGGANAFFQEPGAEVAFEQVAVYEQAMVVSGKLLDDQFQPPPVRYDVGVDLRQIGLGIREPAELLGQALDRLKVSLHGKNQALESKERLLAHLHKRALQGAHLLEAIYAFAGHEGIASRTRQSKHRIREQTVEVVTEPPTPANGEAPDPTEPTPPEGTGESEAEAEAEAEEQDAPDAEPPRPIEEATA
ncbi:MAG: hypothetical protein GY719_03670 [bacterium]|nr:hypothetical protein [bacterium]